MSCNIALPSQLNLIRTGSAAALAMFIMTGCASIPVAQSKSVAPLSKTHVLPEPTSPPPAPSLMDTLLEKLNVSDEKTLADGSKYAGELLEGKKSGRGVYTWPDGARYEGTWVNDRRNGQGTWTSAGGDRYEGTWVNDQRTGHGIYTYIDGRHYEGEFLNDKPSGHGIATDTRGVTYHQFRQGEFLDDAPPFVSIPFGPKITQTAISCKNVPEEWVMIDGKCGSDGPEGAVQWIHVNGLSEFHGTFKSGHPVGEVSQTIITRDMTGKVSVTLLKGKSNAPGVFASAQVNRIELIENKPVWVGYFRGAMQGPNPSGKGSCLFQGKWEACEIRDGQRVDRIHTARIEAEREKQLKAERIRQAEAKKAAQLQKAEEARLEKARQAEAKKAAQLRKAEEDKLEKARKTEERKRLAEEARIQRAERERQLQAEKIQMAEAKKAAKLRKAEEARLEKERKEIANLSEVKGKTYKPNVSSGSANTPQQPSRGTQNSVLDKAAEALARQPLIKACEKVLNECNRISWPLNEGCKTAANMNYPCSEAYK